ncbi:hypothetical protein [Gordonia malaquae]|uniref:hypothetical protein n=1 Tax=Gordonia malaquae TaxID=410332 RepID=UPI003019974F
MALSDDEVSVLLTEAGPRWAVSLTEASPDRDGVPASWSAVVAAQTPQSRVQAAAALWRAVLGDDMAQTQQMITHECADVRLGRSDGQWCLVYLVEHHAGKPYREIRAWVGLEPRPFDDAHPFARCVPSQIASFIATIHDGWTAINRETNGLQAQQYWQSVADAAGETDWSWWEFEPRPESLMVIGTDGGVDCCLSPDIPAGHGVLVYPGDAPDDPKPLADLLDDIVAATL